MPSAVDRCVEHLLNDPNFKPRKGKTREESAWAICQASVGKKDVDTEDLIHKRFLYAPILKTGETNDDYLAVLTDTSIDRDNEIVAKSFMEKAVMKNWLPGLIDHQNKALNLVCNWVDKQIVETSPGHHALVAKPKFFLSNPQARILKNMIDEGAMMGVSISAIPYAHDEVSIDGKTYKRWTDGEIVSADFVGIPANQHAMAMRIAKSFSLKKESEEDTMKEEDIKKIVAETIAEIKKQEESVEAPPAEPQKEPEPAKEEPKAEPEPAEPAPEPASEPAQAEPKAEDKPVEEAKSLKREKMLNKLPHAETETTEVKSLKPTVANFIKVQKGLWR